MRLSPTSYLMLGLVALRGPSTPYDLKRAVRRSVGYFWSFPHTQFYAEPARLTEAGLLKAERETGGRHRLTYTITDQGRQALQAWLATPSGEIMEVRDIAELKLFFSELTSRDNIVELARTQAARLREYVAELEAIEDRYRDRPELSRRLAPLRLGLRIYRAATDFWLDVATDPP